MKKETYNVIGMHCVSCSTGIAKLLRKNKAVDDVQVELSNSKFHITYDEENLDSQTIVDTVGRLGYKAIPAE